MPNIEIVTPPTTRTTLLEWDARTLPHQQRSKRWYAIGGSVVVIGAAYGIMTSSWSFSIVILLCGAMYFLLRDHVPPLKHIVLTDVGVVLENMFTRWEDMEGFWFLQTPEYTELHLVLKAKRTQDIVIQTSGVDLMTLRNTLGLHIPELSDKRERLLDAFIRICKL